MKILELLFNETPGATIISDSSGSGNNGNINPVRSGAEPARVVNGMSPPGYTGNSLKFDVDLMPTSHGGNVEPDDQLQFIGIPVTESILNINDTREFTVSFWAYHEALDSAGNPWDGPKTLSGKDLFCPQHSCGAEAFYIFVRTKNIGASVPVAERGQLAFTGDGPAIVQAGGIDTTGLGGTTSNGYHVPINTWVHIACVLEPPIGADPGKWKIYADGVLVGQNDALPGLADLSTKIFSTNPDGTTATGVDIRFGNFRGDFADGVQRPEPIAIGANDYAFHGYLTAIRMYDHAQSQDEICADITVDTATPEVVSHSPSINFGGVAEGITTARPIEVIIKGCTNTLVNTEFVGAPGPFGLPLGNMINVEGADTYKDSSRGLLWVSYETEAAGTSSTATIRLTVPDASFSEDITITAQTIARPSASVVLVLDRSDSMKGNTGVIGLKKIDLLREAARTFVNLMNQGDSIGIVRYNHDAPPPHFDLVNVGDEILGAGRADAINYINSNELNPSGFTSIGDGIFEAGNLLADNSDEVQAMIVMTDGIENRDRRLSNLDVQSRLSDQTYAIGLGEPSNISTGPLNEIVSGNNTYLLVTGEIDTNNRFRLVKYYTQILSDINNEEIVIDPDGVVVSSKPQIISFNLSETEYEFDMILFSSNPKILRFELETPENKRIHEGNLNEYPNVKFIQKNDLTYFRIKTPVFLDKPEGHVGRWKAHISKRTNNDEIVLKSHNHNYKQDEGIPYSFMVKAASNLKINISLNQSDLFVGSKFFLNAEITEYGIPIQDHFELNAQIIGPNGTIKHVELFQKNDAYQFNIDNNVIPGVYKFRILAEGLTLQGNKITREKILTATINNYKTNTDIDHSNTFGQKELLKQLENWKNILWKCCILVSIILLLLLIALLFGSFHSI